MNLNELLEITRISRDSYNTHVKRAGLDFMKVDLGKGRERFSLWHLVAMQCFFSFFRSGARADLCSLWTTKAATEIKSAFELCANDKEFPHWIFVYADTAVAADDDQFWQVIVSNEWPQVSAGDVERISAVSLAMAIRSTVEDIVTADKAKDLFNWDDEEAVKWWPSYLPLPSADCEA